MAEVKVPVSVGYPRSRVALVAVTMHVKDRYQDIRGQLQALNALIVQRLPGMADKSDFSSTTHFPKNDENRARVQDFEVADFERLQGLYAMYKMQRMHHLSIFDEIYDEVLEEARQKFPASHLLFHAFEGYYIPVEFNQRAPIFDSKGDIPGGWIGSSQELLEELLELAQLLDIQIKPLRGTVRRGGGFDISSDSIEAINDKKTDTICDPKKDQFYREKRLWLALYEASRLSIKFSTPIVIFEI